MELVEITGLFEIETGATMPAIISTDTELFVTFHVGRLNGLDSAQYDLNFTISFNGCIKYTFGSPGNETIEGHPYSRLGMSSYSFYELRNSDLIKSLQEIDNIHPNANHGKWKSYKHYILTFHDNMFECVAKSFEVQNSSVRERALTAVKALSSRHQNPTPF